MHKQRIFTWSVWLLILLSPFPVLLRPVFGFPISPFRIVGLPIMCLACYYIFSVRPLISIFVIGFICSIIFSILIYSNYIDVLSEAWSYLIFISLLIVSKRIPLDIRNITKLFAFVGALGGIIGIYIYIMGSAISMQNQVFDSYLISGRTATLIDASSGVFGAIASIGIILQSKKIKISILGGIALALSFFSLALSQTRSKIIITFLVVLFMILYFGIKGNKRSVFGFVTAIIMILSASFFMSRYVDVVVRSVVDRMSTLNISKLDDDPSTYYRQLEREKEILLIQNSPVIGNGWGLYSRQSVGTFDYGYMSLYGHNMYTALPARVGVPLAIVLISIIMKMLFRIRRRYSAEKDYNKKVDYMISAQVVVAILWLSFTSAGLANNNIAIATIYGIVAGFQRNIYHIDFCNRM